MAREIDPDDIANGTLSWEEAEYLRVRGKLPADYEMPDPPSGEDTAEEPVPTKVTPLEQQSVPVFFMNGGIVDDSDGLEGVGGNYSKEEGWNNPKRREELAKRGLVVDGSMDEMIDRLRRSDSGQLTDDDIDSDDDTE